MLIMAMMISGMKIRRKIIVRTTVGAAVTETTTRARMWIRTTRETGMWTRTTVETVMVDI